MSDLADRRRHGDAFPLNPSWLCDVASSRGIFEPRRAHWSGEALNQLALHRRENSLRSKVLSSTLPPTSAQVSVADRACRSMQIYGECPEGLTPETALAEMRAARSSYDEVPSNLAAYDPSKLKILKSIMKPKYIKQFLPIEASKILEHCETQVLKPECHDAEPFTPYWDPSLKHNRELRLDFIDHLFKAGVLCFRPRARSFVGAFFVKKKDPSAIRMVIDCRGTNRLHQPPPTTRLGSARCYSDLDLCDKPGWNKDRGGGWGREADVNDCFYRFSIPELADYFALAEPMTREQWQARGIPCEFYEDPWSGKNTKTSVGQILYPCFQAVPMGWSWALFFCHEAVLEIARRGSPWADGVFREKKPCPEFGEHKTLLGVYVDNITIIGDQFNDVDERCKAVDAAFVKAGVPITWTQSCPVKTLDSVGSVLDFEEGIIYNKPRRVWRFFRATQALLRRKKLKGDILQVWAGHFTSLCSHTPWGLSCLRHTYRFIEAATTKRLAVWSSVRRELKQAGSVVWMTWRDLRSPLQKQVEVGDSATSGYAMLAGVPDSKLVKRALRVHEKWRFIPMPQALRQAAQSQDVQAFQETLEELVRPVDVEWDNVRPQSVAIAGLSTKYAAMVIDAMKEGSWLATSAIRSQVRCKPNQRADIDVPALIEPVDEWFSDMSNFRVLWAKRWKNVHEVINIKEARVALSSLKKSARVVSLHGCRKLTLSDNLAAVSAFSKGRSGSPSMNWLCQQAAAISFGTGITWHIRHIETKRNPADEPSRRFEKQKVSPAKNLGVRIPFPSAETGVGGGLPREASSSSKPSPPVFGKEVGTPKIHCRYFLEIFSGCGRLSQSCRVAGVPVLEPLDFLNGPHCDLRRRRTQRLVLQWIKSGLIRFVHLGTPCTIWSQARHNVKDSARTRAKECIGVELALFSAEVIQTCNAHGVQYSIENPRFSKLFGFEPLTKAIASGMHFVVDFDMCMYGEPFRKCTRIVTSCKELQQLSNKCCHRRHEVWLKGKVKVEGADHLPRFVNRTALAGAYPKALTDKFAAILSCLSFGNVEQTDLGQVHWSASLRSVAKQGSKKEHCPTNLAQKSCDEHHEKLVLLERQGGLEQFIDFIAIGRNKKEAWRVLKKNKRH